MDYYGFWEFWLKTAVLLIIAALIEGLLLYSVLNRLIRKR